MKKYFVISLLACYFCLPLHAQQHPYLRFYNNNWLFINPASTDRHMMNRDEQNYSIVNLQTRQQWLGFKGAPLTILGTWEFKKAIRSNEYNGRGPRLGGAFYYDKTDAFRTWGGQFNFTYIVKPGNSDNFVQMGLSGGLQHNNLNTTGIIPTLVDPTDPAILGFNRRTLIDFGAGLMYRIPKHAYFGISSPQMRRAYGWRQNGEKGRYGNSFEQIYFMGGGFFNLSRSDSKRFVDRNGTNLNETDALFVLEPSLWVRYTPHIQYISWFGERSKASFDANFRLYGFHKFWMGVGFGSNGNGSFEFGMQRKFDENNKRGVRAGITSSFPLFGGIPALGTSVELFASYFIHYK